MRTFYYVIALAALALAVAGLTAAPPLLDDIQGQVLDDWYAALGWSCAVIGLLTGLAGAEWARRGLRHRPRESGRAFHRRVQTRGLLVLLGAAFLLTVFGVVSAALKGDLPLGTAERIGTLAPTLRFIGMVGLGVFVAAVAYALRTAIGLWGGTHALRPHRSGPAGQSL